jgi:dephospho-CoA kinase
MLFRKRFPGFVLVALKSPFSVRLERLASRGRSDDATTRVSLQARDERELRWGLGAALDLADFSIENESDLAGFTNKVKELLKNLEGGI